MIKNERYRNDLIADQFKGLSQVQLISRIEVIKKELWDMITRNPQNKTLIEFLLQEIVIGSGLISKEFPQSSDEIRIKDVEKMNQFDLLNFIIIEPVGSRMMPVLLSFYRVKFKDICN